MIDQASASHTKVDLICLAEELQSELLTFRSNTLVFRAIADQGYVQIMEMRELREAAKHKLAQMKCLLQQWNEVTESYRTSVFFHC